MNKCRRSSIWFVFCAMALIYAGAQQTPSLLQFENDPVIQDVSDERLRQIYLDTVMFTRQEIWVYDERIQEIMKTAPHGRGLTDKQRNEISTIGDEATARIIELQVRNLSGADNDFVIQQAQWALSQSPVDWQTYRTCVAIMKEWVRPQPKMYSILREALQMPRGEKISDSRGHAILETLQTLGRIRTQESVALLEECTSFDFWGSDPLHSSVIYGKSTRRSVDSLRSDALRAIQYAPSEFSIPALDRLAAIYTDTREKPKDREERRFEDGLGWTIAELKAAVNEREGQKVDNDAN